MTPIRILLADDHALLLEGLRSMLDAEPDLRVVAVASSGEQALDLVRREKPDVVVLDIELDGLNGLAVLQRIRSEGIPVRVLVLTAYSDGASVRGALEGGADGFALKTEPPQQTIASIRQVHRGQLVFPDAAKRWLLGRTSAADPDKLTDREAAVLVLLAEGVTNAEIARQLRVSENTVKFHLQNLYTKLGVSNRTEAAAHFLRDRTHRR